MSQFNLSHLNTSDTKPHLRAVTVCCRLIYWRWLFSRGQMHCDRVPDQSRDLSRGRERVSEHDDREARYWSRKLYDFEANDPDRYRKSSSKYVFNFLHFLGNYFWKISEWLKRKKVNCFPYLYSRRGTFIHTV